MTTGLTYNQYVTELANLAIVDPADANFVTNLPQCITYAENRIYRDLDLLSTVTAASGFSCATGSRQITWPLSQFVTVQEINVITPAGTADPNAGTRVSLWPDTPTANEAVPGYSSGGWFGYVAPAGTPPAIVKTLSDAIIKSVRSPEVVSFLEGVGSSAVGNTPEEFTL